MSSIEDFKRTLQIGFDGLKEEYKNTYTEMWSKHPCCVFIVRDEGKEGEEWIMEPLLYIYNYTDKDAIENNIDFAAIGMWICTEARTDLEKFEKDKVTVIGMKRKMEHNTMTMSTYVTVSFNCCFKEKYHKKMFPNGGRRAASRSRLAVIF